MISIAKESLPLRRPAISAGLRLLMPAFSLPYAPVLLADEPSSRMECSPTSLLEFNILEDFLASVPGLKPVHVSAHLSSTSELLRTL